MYIFDVELNVNKNEGKNSMKLEYEKINKDNIVIAAKIQHQIFPVVSAYSKYLREIKSDEKLPINFLIYEKNTPIGVVGLKELKEDPDSIWLSWFGVIQEYRFKGYGSQILDDILGIAKKYNRKYLRLLTYEVWNSVAQKFYKKHMQLEEYYTNKNDNQENIKEGIPKIFSYSLCDEPVPLWDNKFIDIASEDRDNLESIELMKKDGIIDIIF